VGCPVRPTSGPAPTAGDVEVSRGGDDRAAMGSSSKGPQLALKRRVGHELPPTVIRRGKGVLINIPARRQAPGSPRAGWCGETAIQEALLYHGAYYPQRLINRAGKPSHPDLYASDIPRALIRLGVDFVRYSWAVKGFAKFHTWLVGQVGRGVPVLTGMKIHPTAHPTWGLDHFVLAVGYDVKSVTVNTTWGHRARRTLKQVTSEARGLSFRNRTDRYYGLGIRGFARRSPDARPVRLFVTRETAKRMWVQVKCEGLSTRRRYRVQRFASRRPRHQPVRTWMFTAKDRAHVVSDVVDKRRPALYRCEPAMD
jgi:hypothetical protein